MSISPVENPCSFARIRITEASKMHYLEKKVRSETKTVNLHPVVQPWQGIDCNDDAIMKAIDFR